MKIKTVIKGLFVVLLSSTAAPLAFAQSPWVTPPNTPVHGSVGGGIGVGGSNILSFAAPQAGKVWTLVYTYYGLSRGEHTVIVTGNGGQTWQVSQVAQISRTGTGPGTGTYGTVAQDLSAIDAQNAWLIKYTIVPGSVGTPSGNAILARTTTGAAGFADMPNPMPAPFQKIHFFTMTTGIAVAGSVIYRTTDAGATWAVVSNMSGLAGDITSKYDVDNSLWLTTSGGTLVRTADAGLTWTSIANVGELVAFEADAQHGLAYGNQLRRTSDGGSTWVPVAFSGQPQFGTMTAVPGLPGTYISGGYQSSYSTTSPVTKIYTGTTTISRDYGSSWQVMSTDSTAFRKLWAVSAGEIWAGVDYMQGAQVGPPPNQPLVKRYAATALATRSSRTPTALVVAYPNPTAGLLKLDGPLQGEEEARLYDVAGRLCQQEKVSNGHRQLDLTALPAGLYYLTLTAASGEVRSQRVSKNL